MNNNVKVSVSSLPVEEDLQIKVKEIQKYADFLHCDFMDGTITKNKTKLDCDIVKNINKISTIPLDVHLMTNSPNEYIQKFKDAGSNIITIHYEVFENNSQIIECLNKIKDRYTLCGLAVDLTTQIDKIDEILPYVDIVLVMSVNIGKYGQTFDNSVYDKVKHLVDLRKSNKYKYLISVDGGINNINCVKLKEMGVDILVSGGYVFNENNYQQSILELKK